MQWDMTNEVSETIPAGSPGNYVWADTAAMICCMKPAAFKVLCM